MKGPDATQFKLFLKCDRCGKLGAFDFMGDALCYKCAMEFMPQEEKEDTEYCVDEEIFSREAGED